MACLLNADILCDSFWIRFLRCLPKLSFESTCTPRYFKPVTLFRFAISIPSPSLILHFGLNTINSIFPEQERVYCSGEARGHACHALHD